jgi:CRISPR-associated protein Cas2
MDGPPGTLRQNEVAVSMSEKRQWYLVSYDVRDDKRLRLVAKQLKGYGSRIQLSVFRCRLKAKGIERLKWELTKIMAPEDDLLIIGLCEKCADKVSRRNVDERWREDISMYEIV